ncbi:hypothetical protein RP20_CCG010542 [Aedes albopictus]|nr:hypothetical protein RP20_CCG010542 [Aedes albopictus]
MVNRTAMDGKNVPGTNPQYLMGKITCSRDSNGVLSAAGWFFAALLQVPGTADNRKLRLQNRMGHFELVHMEGFTNELLQEERACDIIHLRIQKRDLQEENNEPESKVSALDDDLEMPTDDDGNLEKINEAVKEKAENYPDQGWRW